MDDREGTETPEAPRTIVCPTHGLRYDPKTHEGCLRCRQELPAGQSEAGRFVNPSDVNLQRGRTFAKLMMLGTAAVAIVFVFRMAGNGTMKGLPGSMDVPEPAHQAVGLGTVDPEPYRRQIEGIDAEMDRSGVEGRSLADSILNLGTELIERTGARRIAGQRLMQCAQRLPGDFEGRRLEWRRVRDENFLLAPWFRNGPPRAEPSGAAPTQAPREPTGLE